MVLSMLGLIGRRYRRVELALLVLFMWGWVHLHRSYHSSSPSENHAHSILHQLQLQREQQIVGQISKMQPPQLQQEPQIRPQSVHLPMTKTEVDKLTEGVSKVCRGMFAG
eukprot:6673781-Pyramimonas_sp.AAC.1